MHGVIVWSDMLDREAFLFSSSEAGLQVSKYPHVAIIRNTIRGLGVFGVFDDATSVLCADGARIDRVFLRPRYRKAVFRLSETLAVYVEHVLEHREVEDGKAVIDHLVTHPIGVALWKGSSLSGQ